MLHYMELRVPEDEIPEFLTLPVFINIAADWADRNGVKVSFFRELLEDEDQAVWVAVLRKGSVIATVNCIKRTRYAKRLETMPMYTNRVGDALEAAIDREVKKHWESIAKTRRAGWVHTDQAHAA